MVMMISLDFGLLKHIICMITHLFPFSKLITDYYL